jgi:hypothetical protein
MTWDDSEVATAVSGDAFQVAVVTLGGQRWPMSDPIAWREG